MQHLSIGVRNRYLLRQNKFHLPAAYPRTDLASLILTGPPTLLDHREAVSGILQMTSFTRVPGHPKASALCFLYPSPINVNAAQSLGF